MEVRNHIGFELRLAQNMMEANMREQREQDGFCLTQIQHWIIRFLEKNCDRDIFQRDLEEEFHTSRATISSTLQVMERNGLIVRSAVEQDARLKKISLTQKAMDVRSHIRGNVEAMENRMRRGMSDEEVALLLTLLRRVQDNLRGDRKEDPPDGGQG